MGGSWVSSCSNSPATTDAGSDAAFDSGPVVTGDWSCLGTITQPAPTSPTIQQPILLVAATGGQALAGLTVKACGLSDVSCSTVLDTQTTDATGVATFPTLPTGTSGFGGYFEVDATQDMPNLDFVDPPLFTTFPTYSRAYYSGAALTSIASLISATLDSTRGHILIQAHDCGEFSNGVPCRNNPSACHTTILPAGVTFTIDVADSKTIQAYVVGTASGPALDLSATSTSDGWASGGFLNVPPGPGADAKDAAPDAPVDATPDGPLCCDLGFKQSGCHTCTADETCWNKVGSCAHSVTNCGPWNCQGCCQSPTECADGLEVGSCGNHGQFCQTCIDEKNNKIIACIADDAGAGGTCLGGPTCNVQNCHAGGCCNGDLCMLGDTALRIRRDVRRLHEGRRHVRQASVRVPAPVIAITGSSA